jgi:hypothetical protein
MKRERKEEGRIMKEQKEGRIRKQNYEVGRPNRLK